MYKFEISHFVLGRYAFQISTKGGKINFVPDFVGPVMFILKKVSEASAIDVESQVRMEVAIISDLVDGHGDLGSW